LLLRKRTPKPATADTAGTTSSGFFMTSSGARGSCNRAVAEFLEAFSRHAPSLVLRPLTSGGTSFSFLEVEGMQDAAATLEAAFDSMRLVGEGFRHVRRVFPVDGVCRATTMEIEMLIRRLAAGIVVAGTSIAICLQMGGLHSKDEARCIRRKEFISAIAAALPQGHRVDLTNPEVVVHARSFAEMFGCSVHQATRRLECPTCQDTVYAAASAGQTYYRRDINLGHAVEPPCAPSMLFDVCQDMESWRKRLSPAACPACPFCLDGHAGEGWADLSAPEKQLAGLQANHIRKAPLTEILFESEFSLTTSGPIFKIGSCWPSRSRQRKTDQTWQTCQENCPNLGVGFKPHKLS